MGAKIRGGGGGGSTVVDTPRTWVTQQIFNADAGGTPTIEGDAAGSAVFLSLLDTDASAGSPAPHTASLKFSGHLTADIDLLVPNSAGTLITTQSTSTLANKRIDAMKSSSLWGGSPALSGDGSSVSVSCQTQSNTTVLCAATAGIVIGQIITGSGIPANTYVVTLTVNTSFTINNAATNSTTTTRTFSPITASSSGTNTGGGAKINLTGVTANLSTVNLLLTNGAPAGMYVISAVLECTTLNVSGTPPTLTANWTDDTGARSQPLITNFNTTTVHTVQSSNNFYVLSGNTTWNVTGWTAGTYAVRMRVTYLGT